MNVLAQLAKRQTDLDSPDHKGVQGLSADNPGSRFTDEATAEYGLAVTRYSDNLEALSKARCNAEIVLADHVRAAVKELGPNQDNETAKVALDWCKRLAFLFIGFAVVQGSNVMHQQDGIARGSVLWLIADALVAAVLSAIALLMDFPYVRNLLGRDG
ncbi:hypothetical protein AWB85_15305 [Mycobacteroides immunogenum]|uniref:Uncharacterized protein n=1 Tax=Mycobacteroides immunogenum TaxID=83262 RepID=A0A179V7J6_9MYCO|nr:hypothetical protein [Mycobacteroides immunogenum]OAT66981.1 hypothetical protein AWB85_15305 [Mycobacteroides immunogenum]